MVNKRDIGDVFSERLQDFELAPPSADKIWEQITTELDIPQDNDKAAPFWWRSAGLGILAIGLIATLVYFGPTWFGATTNLDKQEITNQEPINTKGDANFTEDAILESENKDNQNSDQDTNKNTQITSSSAVSSEILDSQNNTAPTNDAIVNESNASQNTVTGNNTDTKFSNNSESPITSSNPKNNSIQDSSAKNKSIKNTSNPLKTTQPIAQNTANNVVSANNNSSNKNIVRALNKERSAISGNKKLPARGYYVIKKSTLKKQGVTKNFVYSEQTPVSGQMAQPLPVIALTYDNLVKAKKSKAMRALEREIRTKEALDYKWTVGAIVAPTTYGSVTRGSMLDARLVDNPRQGETNLSYGIKVKNQFTSKSALRFGVNQINLGYNTQNFQVNIIEGIVNVYQLTGIDPRQEISDGISLNAEATAFFEANDVVGIDQRISYIEFPLEYEYAVINSRFGANLIGGSSLIVLSDNRIFATSDQGQNLEVGTASNLTSLGYTLNLGLGLDYEISKHLQFNVDPIFKLQLNGPNNTATNNFRPYYFGIYSGLSFKF